MPRKKHDEPIRHAQGYKGGEAYMQRSLVSPFLGAAMGAAVGAAVGAAAVIILSDKDKRERIRTTAENFRERAMRNMQNMRGKITQEESPKEEKKAK